MSALDDFQADIRRRDDELARLRDEIVWMRQRAERAEAQLQRVWDSEEQSISNARWQANSYLTRARAELMPGVGLELCETALNHILDTLRSRDAVPQRAATPESTAP